MAGLRLGGHPLHPLLVHFPIALWASVSLWDLLALVRGDSLWWAMAFWSLIAGLVLAVPAALAGLADFVALGPSHPADRIANLHLATMLGAAGLYGLSAFARDGPGVLAGADRTLALVTALGGLALVAVGGWLGGQLVYRFGVGVDLEHAVEASSKPDPESGARSSDRTA